ncbi:MAG: 50S ribosomal protein L2 [Alphaproteobacteria bacterium MarineAlpha5_Bin9]|nr:MAG: 50S ribosomal protein L2 [Alphaproteobacteria bacterium MarineAlpha5_Bin9]|tara:strand:+ start:318 stop:1145 length:828 start_codon:yes stop_codon:yes gene_type:complete
MSLKHLKPTTPGQRGTVLIDKSVLWKKKPMKSLVKKISSTGGRNNQGRITSRRMGGGVKRKYRIIDFKRNKFGIEAEVVRNEYDPNRSSFISLIKYKDGEYRYIISPKNIKIGSKVVSGEQVEINDGNALPIKNIPLGTNIHNVELKPGAGGQLARSAGTYAQIIAKEANFAQLRLVSGEIRLININCYATIGAVSNSDNQNIKFGKAGRKRKLGFRPKVRGVVMNPVDHPHGGGEGRTSGGRHPVTPWGKSTKGKKTRNNKRTNYLIIKRRKKK